MTIEDIYKDNTLTPEQKGMMAAFLLSFNNDKINSFQKGGNIDATKETFKEKEKKTITPTTTIKIGDKEFQVAVAKTEEEKMIGLSQVDYLDKDRGMLFVYEEPQEDLWFTMEDTSIDLDIIFIDEEGYVTSVNTVKAFSKTPVEDIDGTALFVLEVNANSGIKVDDELEDYNDEESEEDEDLTEEEKETVKKSKMLVLDENGDVLMKLVGGERIFSRISTKKFIKAAIKAFKSDNDSDYRKVGKLVFEELNAQDSRDIEYVQSPK